MPMYTFNKIDPHVQDDIFFHFADKVNGYKVKKHIRIIMQGRSYTLPNSIIKIDGELYQLATGKQGTIGAGQFGKVKYVQHLLSGKSFALKVESYTPQNPYSNKKFRDEDREHFIKIENNVNLDINLSIANTQRRKQPNHSKNYSVMHYMGQDLKNIIDEPIKHQLTDDRRFDISIKLCFEVYMLHNGLLSNHTNKYTHQDIKPANITLKNYSDVKLVDYGLVQRHPEHIQRDFIGSPAYMPSPYELSKETITKQQKDMLALKRTLYLPHIIKCALGLKIDEHRNHHNMSFLLPKHVLNNQALAIHIDTGGQYSNAANSTLTPLSLMAILILAKYNLSQTHYLSAKTNQAVAALIVGHYFSKDKSNIKHRLLHDLNKYRSFYFPHKKRATDMNFSEKLALLASYGIKDNIDSACQNTKLLNLLASSESLELKKTAIILFNLSILDLESSSINILKNNPEILPSISEYYHRESPQKIINVFLLPVSLARAMEKLKQASCSNSIFLISRNAAILKALVLSPSVNYTKALIFLFKNNNKIGESEIKKLNGYTADAINFLVTYNKEELCHLAIEGNNAILFYGIEKLISSKILPHAEKHILTRLKCLIENPFYADLIKDNPSAEKTAIIHHLFSHNLQPKTFIINQIFSNQNATNNLLDYVKNQSMPLSIFKKIISNEQTANAFIHLSNTKKDLKLITYQLQSDIRVNQINTNLEALPRHPCHMPAPLKNSPYTTSTTKHPESARPIHNESSLPSLHNIKGSALPKQSPHIRARSNIAPLPNIKKTQESQKKDFIAINRNRFFNPITHEKIDYKTPRSRLSTPRVTRA